MSTILLQTLTARPKEASNPTQAEPYERISLALDRETVLRSLLMVDPRRRFQERKVRRLQINDEGVVVTHRWVINWAETIITVVAIVAIVRWRRGHR